MWIKITLHITETTKRCFLNYDLFCVSRSSLHKETCANIFSVSHWFCVKNLQYLYVYFHLHIPFSFKTPNNLAISYLLMNSHFLPASSSPFSFSSITYTCLLCCFAYQKYLISLYFSYTHILWPEYYFFHNPTWINFFVSLVLL